VRDRIAADREYVKGRITEWRFFENLLKRLGLAEDTVWCARRRTQWEELLECLDEMERVAA
jgi:hypothetical protein